MGASDDDPSGKIAYSQALARSSDLGSLDYAYPQLAACSAVLSSAASPN